MSSSFFFLICLFCHSFIFSFLKILLILSSFCSFLFFEFISLSPPSDFLSVWISLYRVPLFSFSSCLFFRSIYLLFQSFLSSKINSLAWIFFSLSHFFIPPLFLFAALFLTTLSPYSCYPLHFFFSIILSLSASNGICLNKSPAHPLFIQIVTRHPNLTAAIYFSLSSS